MTSSEKGSKEYNSYYYKKKKALQVCVSCGQQDARTIIGRTRCYECFLKQKESSKKYRQTEKYKTKDKERYKKDKENGMCIQCHKRKPDPGYATCSRCLARKKAYRMKRKLKTFDTTDATYCGLCWQCKKRPILEGKKLCENCYNIAVKNIKKGQESAHKSNANHPFRESERLRIDGYKKRKEGV